MTEAPRQDTEQPRQNDSPSPDQGFEQRFTSLFAFYDARGGKLSGECDYGSWWTGDRRGMPSTWPRYRVSVVHDTGDLYALNFADNSVEVLATLTPHECEPNGLKHEAGCAYAKADALLEGWAHDGPKALSWVRERLQAVAA